MVARLLAMLLLTAAPLAASPAAAAPVASRGDAHAQLAAVGASGARLLSCRRSPALDQRVAVVGTWMRPVGTGTRLSLRIDLLERTPGQPWTTRTDVPGLGTWLSPSDARLGTHAGDVFKYRQAVGRLLAPAAYRFRVSFRWVDAAGAVVRQNVATTQPCREPDLRTDLVPLSVTTAPARGGLVRYAVLVGNEGRSPAVRVAVAATFPGEATPNGHLRRAGPLPPGATALVTFIGPGCAAGGQPATFVVDPSNAVDEANEGDDELAATCPAP